MPVPGVEDCAGSVTVAGDAGIDDEVISALELACGNDELDAVSVICIGLAGGDKILGCDKERAARSLSCLHESK